jgi:hypothetical protein
MLILRTIIHLACVIIAGRRYRLEYNSSLGFIAGFLAGPIGIFIVYVTPNFLANISFSHEMDSYRNSPISDPTILKYTNTYGENKKNVKLHYRPTASGFIASRQYMPVTDGCFATFLMGSILYGFQLFFPIVFASVVEPVSSGLMLERSLAFLVFFIPFLMCIFNYRTMKICPRCGHNHQVTGSFETFMGTVIDFDPNETGCRECDYLPSRDRDISIT